METLGQAVLELGADTAPLDFKLRDAKAKVLAAVAEMQAELDTLRINPDLGRISAARLAAESAAAGAAGSALAPVAGGRGGSGGNALWGVRGPDQPGSRNNPVVFVEEAAKYTPLGSLAAAVGESNANDESSGNSPLATAADMAALRAQVGRLADDAALLRSTGTQRPSSSSSPLPWTVSSADNTTQRVTEVAAVKALQDAASALDRIRMQQERDRILAVPRVGSAGGSRSTRTVNDTTIYDYSGSGGTTILGGSGGSGGGGRGGPPIAYAPFSGGGGGNKRVDVFYHASGDGGGGGGGGGSSLTSSLLWGGGSALGLAGFGSLGSLAGLGPEHLLMTAGGILGSAGTALGGAGLLGLGALGVGGAGMAADASSIGQAANDIKSVVQAQNALNTAIAVYGKNSTDAKTAQAQLNAALAGFSPVARSAVLQAANTAQAFHQAFNKATGPAEAVGANILNQGMQVGMTFLPSLGQASLTDAKIIKQALQPLFTWLSGPEGLGIFQNLEHEFTQNLPAGISLFTNATESVLRIMNLASADTGGFVQHLDDLFKKLNGMSNVQLEQVIQRLIGDFRVWERFIKALGTDIFRLFNNDVGTGKSIIVTLTQMLNKLGDWENSIKGRQDLMTIFTVHKNEVQALLHLLPLLLDPLAKLYLTVAPAATKALTDLAKGITAVVKALESIPGGSWLLAIGLLGSRLGILGRILTGGGAATAGGAGAAAAGAGTAEGAAGGAASAGLLAKLFGAVGRTGAGEAISGGVTDATLAAGGAVEGTALAGLADSIAAAGTAIAPLAAGLLPVLGVAGGVYGLIKLLDFFTSTPAVRTTYTPAQYAHLLQSSRPDVLSMPAIKGASTAPTRVVSPRLGVVSVTPAMTLKDTGPTPQAQAELKSWVATMGSSVQVSKRNTTQLVAMAREGDRLATVFPKYAQLIDKLNAPIHKLVLSSGDVMKILTDRWRTDLTAGLGTIEDNTAASMRLIASSIGSSSDLGRKKWKNNIDQMVKDVTDGMVKGRIAVDAGMTAINKVTTAGWQGNAITWQHASSLQLASLDALYKDGKIPPQQYFQDVNQLTQQGMSQIGQSQISAITKANANIKQQYSLGVINKQTETQELHQEQLNANKQQAQDLKLWLAGLEQQMSAGGTVSVQGANAILTPLNTALQELGQKPVTLVTLQALNAIPSAGSFNPGATPGGPSLTGAPTFPGMTGIPGAATGALYQIGQPGQGGHDTVPLNVAGTPVMVGAGEQVAVFNRHQQPIVNMALGLLGYDGMSGLFSDVSTPNFMAGGGQIKTPSAAGGGAQGTLLNAAFRMLGVDANRLLKKKRAQHAASAGGAGGTVAPSAWRTVAKMLAAKAGWGPSELEAWIGVEDIEDPAFSLTAQNPTSSAYGLAQGITGPGWYAAHGGNANTLLGQLTAMFNYIRSRYGTPSAALAHEHSSGFYAAGGFPFGQGGDRFAGKPSGTSQDMGLFKSAMATISGLVGSNVGSGGDAGRMQELLSYYPGLWAISNPNLGQPASAFITTTDALGNSIQPSIDQASVTLSAGELAKELGWEDEYIKDLGSARSMAKTWHPKVQTAIAKRRGEILGLRGAEAARIKALRVAEAAKIAKLRADEAADLKAIRTKIRANLTQIAAYQKQITSLNNQVTTEQGKKKPNYAAISGWRKQISGLNQKISDLQGENQTLGGAGTYVGTGGTIASTQNQYASEIAFAQKDYGSEITGTQKDYGTQITGLQSEVTTLSAYSSALAAIPGTVSGETGVGGLLGPALTQQSTLQSEIAQLGPSALQAALASADAQYASSTTSSSTTSDQALLDQARTLYADAAFIMNAQSSVFANLANLPPFGGSFKDGGIVPGAWGEPKMILAHGGEVVTPADRAGGMVHETHVHIQKGSGLERIIDTRVEHVTRGMAKKAMRPRAGQRAGMLTLSR